MFYFILKKKSVPEFKLFKAFLFFESTLETKAGVSQVLSKELYVFEDVCSCLNNLQNQCQHQARQWYCIFQERASFYFFLEIKIFQTKR